MVHHLDGGEAVCDHITGVELLDINGGSFLAGDQDRMGGKTVFIERGGNDGIVIDGGLASGRKILIS